ncbi:hypothetical protein DFP72DRAFT_844302 [Ephemerocybe angulata]|uniref:Uncharacterized protein n=1 Tax=Ephemerocybe angulata TaxID=980116 RepID=A0A8H6MC19_9AGAR|nr:hypothetical protein DFP72DRAFT_844302 [Tulosesus angulatus]
MYSHGCIRIEISAVDNGETSSLRHGPASDHGTEKWARGEWGSGGAEEEVGNAVWWRGSTSGEVPLLRIVRVNGKRRRLGCDFPPSDEGTGEEMRVPPGWNEAWGGRLGFEGTRRWPPPHSTQNAAPALNAYPSSSWPQTLPPRTVTSSPAIAHCASAEERLLLPHPNPKVGLRHPSRRVKAEGCIHPMLKAIRVESRTRFRASGWVNSELLASGLATDWRIVHPRSRLRYRLYAQLERGGTRSSVLRWGPAGRCGRWERRIGDPYTVGRRCDCTAIGGDRPDVSVQSEAYAALVNRTTSAEFFPFEISESEAQQQPAHRTFSCRRRSRPALYSAVQTPQSPDYEAGKEVRVPPGLNEGRALGITAQREDGLASVAHVHPTSGCWEDVRE